MKKIAIITGLTAISLVIFLLYDMNYDIFSYVIEKRMEKVIAMVLVAVAIGLSTLTFQTITNNRILTPGILGLDSLYILFQLLTVILLGSTSLVSNPYLNFMVSALLLTVFSLLLYRRVFTRSNSMYFMVLVGVVMGTFFTSINGMLQIMLSPDVFNMVLSKMFANFSLVNEDLILLSSVLIIILAILLYKKRYVLDVLSLGKDHSINLGLNYKKEVTGLLVMVFLLVALSTALVGPITFLGFFSVNIVKNFMKTHQHSALMLATSLVSLMVLFIGQILVEHVFNFGLPISVLISMIGGMYFIRMLMKENKA